MNLKCLKMSVYSRTNWDITKWMTLTRIILSCTSNLDVYKMINFDIYKEKYLVQYESKIKKSVELTM